MLQKEKKSGGMPCLSTFQEVIYTIIVSVPIFHTCFTKGSCHEVSIHQANALILLPIINIVFK